MDDASLVAALGASSREELLAAYRQGSRRVAPGWAALVGDDAVPEWAGADELVASADRYCGHVLDLLGSGPTSLGDPIPWHTDFVSGRSWRPVYYRLSESANEEPGCDRKRVWELNRCHHFVTLAQASWLTGRSEYAHEVASQLRDWVGANPYAFGVNWTCAMEAAIRAANWLWAWELLATSDAFADDGVLLLLKSLLFHGRYIAQNLENEGPCPGNHYLADLAGLANLGLFLRGCGEADEWLGFALPELWREVERQTLPDGANFELALGYHLLATEVILHSVLACDHCGVPVPQTVWSRLEKSIEFTMHYTRPDGLAPMMGDSDDGRWVVLSEDTRDQPSDHRHLLSTGAVVFGRSDFARAAGGLHAETRWLLGSDAVSRFPEPAASDQPAPPESRGFPDAGLYVMRCDDLYSIVDAGTSGTGGRGPHAHNDALSFEICVGDTPFIVDPGTYCYSLDIEARNLFRSTEYHSTVQVDGQEINRLDPSRIFVLEDEAAPEVLEWLSTPGLDRLVAEHRGYARLPQPVIHRRAIELDKERLEWRVQDDLMGEGVHDIAWRLHMGVGCRVGIAEGTEEMRLRVSSPTGRELLVAVEVPEGMTLEEYTTWRSPRYGVRVAAQSILLTGRVEVPLRLRARLAPSRPGPADTHDRRSQP